MSGPANRATTDVLCVLSSTVSGEPLAVLETYEGISAKEMKQSLQSQIGVPRFRQKLFLEDRTQEIQDDEVFALQPVKMKLVLSEFWPHGRSEQSHKCHN